MAPDVADASSPPEVLPSDREPPGPRRRRRAKAVLIGLAVALAVLVGAVVWFFVGRERATELSDDQAVTEFRATSGGAAQPASDVAGRPPAGVYAATATGTESIGLPGLDEELGPNAPVTVSHGEDGCFVYRTDLNSHHWRSWTFCPTGTAELSLVELESWTARAVPGLDLETLTTYTCERPVDLRWQEAVAGATRTGACTGRSDFDDAVTLDAAEVEVLGGDTIMIAGEVVEVDRVRITDTFSQAQTGQEVGEWWIAADTGLPVKVVIEAELSGDSGSYAENFELELSTLSPAT